MAPYVSDIQELGALLYESEVLPKEAMALLDTTESGSAFQDALLKVFGQKHQEDYGGVFTSRGYVEPGNDFKEVYRRGGIMAYFDRLGAPVDVYKRQRLSTTASACAAPHDQGNTKGTCTAMTCGSRECSYRIIWWAA